MDDRTFKEQLADYKPTHELSVMLNGYREELYRLAGEIAMGISKGNVDEVRGELALINKLLDTTTYNRDKETGMVSVSIKG